MERSPSKNPDKAKKPSEDRIGREEEIILFLGDLRLNEDRVFHDKIPTASQANNVSQSRPNPYQATKIQSLQVSCSDSNEASKIESLKESSSHSSGVPQIPNRGESVISDDLSDDAAESAPHRNFSSEYNIWTYNDYPTIGLLAAGYPRTNTFLWDDPSRGSSSRHTVTSYSRKCFNDISTYRNTGFNHGDRYNTIPAYEPNESLLEGSPWAKASITVTDVMKHHMSLFGEADNSQRERLISFLQGAISLIMVDEELHPMFLKVVDLCEGNQLSLLVEAISTQEEPFIKAAFCTKGSSFIVEIIRRLKRIDQAYAITSILAKRFYELTTHHTARNVITECLNLFGNGPNEVLYEKAIRLFKHLAVTAAGCRCLNDCIDKITGFQKATLLLDIAEDSAFLSHDPYGNYVVQHVLELRNEVINGVIFKQLQGNFVLLAKKQAGSHVVEKCLKSCKRGTFYVVQDILQCKGAAILLARDQFGNYVIQTALRMTKIWGFTNLYGSLVDTLEHYYEELTCSKGGRQVIRLIEDELYYRWQRKFNGRLNSV